MAQTPHTISKRILPTSETWLELKRAWKSYKMAKLKSNKEKMVESANRIHQLQKVLGAKPTKFSEIPG